MSAPLVSVLVPTYNGERFVGAAIATALAQTHANLEVIVGDDGSTDGTPEILARLAGHDDRVRIIRHAENVGAFENPIRLLEAARGEYVKFLLHDDLLHPDCVATLVAGMEADPSITLATSKRGCIDENSVRLEDPAGFGALTAHTGALDGIELGNTMLRLCCNLVGELSTTLFRRADVDPRELWHVDGRRLAALGDFGLWLALLARGRVFYTPCELSWFRMHATQRSGDETIQGPGLRDWPLLIDWGRRNGFLADPAHERHALANIMQVAASVHTGLAGGPHAPVVLETIYLAMARLVELGGGASAPDPDAPSAERLHDPAFVASLATELHMLPWRAPCAIAAPALDAAEIDAAVEALREVAAEGRADRLVLTVAPGDLDAAVPLIEAALARGSDIDVDLITADDPTALVEPSWLVV